MRKIIQIVAIAIVMANMTGCATPYMVDRKRDAADIFTATTGFGFGGKMRVGPIQAALILEVESFGLRGGQLIVKSNCNEFDLENTGDFQVLFGGLESFKPEESWEETIGRGVLAQILRDCAITREYIQKKI